MNTMKPVVSVLMIGWWFMDVKQTSLRPISLKLISVEEQKCELVSVCIIKEVCVYVCI